MPRHTVQSPTAIRLEVTVSPAQEFRQNKHSKRSVAKIEGPFSGAPQMRIVGSICGPVLAGHPNGVS